MGFNVGISRIEDKLDEWWTWGMGFDWTFIHILKVGKIEFRFNHEILGRIINSKNLAKLILNSISIYATLIYLCHVNINQINNIDNETFCDWQI